MQGNLDRKIGIERLERGGVGGVIDGVVPNALGQRGMQHGRVVGFIEGAESWSECADAGVAVDLQIENLDGERVARFRAFDKEWASEGIVALHHAECVAGLFEDVAETIERVGIENVAGLQMGNRLRRGEEILYVGVGGGVVDGVLGEGGAHQQRAAYYKINKRTSGHKTSGGRGRCKGGL